MEEGRRRGDPRGARGRARPTRGRRREKGTERTRTARARRVVTPRSRWAGNDEEGGPRTTPATAPVRAANCRASHASRRWRFWPRPGSSVRILKLRTGAKVFVASHALRRPGVSAARSLARAATRRAARPPPSRGPPARSSSPRRDLPRRFRVAGVARSPSGPLGAARAPLRPPRLLHRLPSRAARLANAPAAEGGRAKRKAKPRCAFDPAPAVRQPAGGAGPGGADPARPSRLRAPTASTPAGKARSGARRRGWRALLALRRPSPYLAEAQTSTPGRHLQARRRRPAPPRSPRARPEAAASGRAASVRGAAGVGERRRAAASEFPGRGGHPRPEPRLRLRRARRGDRREAQAREPAKPARVRPRAPRGARGVGGVPVQKDLRRAAVDARAGAFARRAGEIQPLRCDPSAESLAAARDRNKTAKEKKEKAPPAAPPKTLGRRDRPAKKPARARRRPRGPTVGAPSGRRACVGRRPPNPPRARHPGAPAAPNPPPRRRRSSRRPSANIPTPPRSRARARPWRRARPARARARPPVARPRVADPRRTSAALRRSRRRIRENARRG